MTEDTSPETQDEPSVFGNLPRTRPGARSPRRDEAAAARDRAEAKQEAEAQAEAEVPSPEADAESILAASRPDGGEPGQAPEDAPPAGDEDGGGIEELAWAGVAAAAEAATLGVRLANKAMESLRGGSEDS